MEALWLAFCTLLFRSFAESTGWKVPGVETAMRRRGAQRTPSWTHRVSGPACPPNVCSCALRTKGIPTLIGDGHDLRTVENSCQDVKFFYPFRPEIQVLKGNLVVKSELFPWSEPCSVSINTPSPDQSDNDTAYSMSAPLDHCKSSASRPGPR